ncbi:hypothetical protein L917_06513 [Phytophthora nicotianae]|uniref:Uncharacterized protein n=4 Tax=Phytophthora nicotianae TaxID=4792 RepID=W2RD69_PHYN3|nr:hypothetical protein PPTG_20987 [Phytophthora nicotianae INRA-310]ETI49233.1 hypothetical protein F443_06833 [Phytophthora nicotianae P1569]ETL42559.1 hypothetical protein L916_06641 [Phytophthora nicotianae]ETO77966.1 hypothetical protein F444_06900 [Phytophthora nicotianae P1976]ETL95728.1 hypothetical protein L917_06513 [Phytophthora nicotianae]ETM30601.1 hypothetical protein L914_21721 [Phytophthora nicotianae]
MIEAAPLESHITLRVLAAPTRFARTQLSRHLKERSILKRGTVRTETAADA